MKKLVVTLLATLALACVVALPTSAVQQVPIGPKFQPLTGQPTTFPAGTAFHLENCWNLLSTAQATGKFSITLDVDGTPRTDGFTQFSSPVVDGVTYNLRCFAWNFPNGLSAGSHTFVEHWFAPCYATPGPCTKPNDVVEEFTLPLTVVFF